MRGSTLITGQGGPHARGNSVTRTFDLPRATGSGGSNVSPPSRESSSIISQSNQSPSVIVGVTYSTYNVPFGPTVVECSRLLGCVLIALAGVHVFPQSVDR